MLCLQYPFPPGAPPTAAVQLGFLPLNHLMGRMTLLKCLLTGGQVSRGHFRAAQSTHNHCRVMSQHTYVGHPWGFELRAVPNPCGFAGFGMPSLAVWHPGLSPLAVSGFSCVHENLYNLLLSYILPFRAVRVLVP